MNKGVKNRIAVTCAMIAVVGIGFGVFRYVSTHVGPLRVIRGAGEYFPRTRLTLFQRKVLADAEQQTRDDIVYRDGYYIGGDPPPKIGVCTDVVVRAYRVGGVDLKRLVNADVRARPRAYRISKPDPNIDYRRTRNLAVFFRRYAQTLPTAGNGADWQPGDILIFDTSGNGYADHVGVVSDGVDENGNPTMIHHWPRHYVAQTSFVDVLPILYHFRWKKAV